MTPVEYLIHEMYVEKSASLFDPKMRQIVLRIKFSGVLTARVLSHSQSQQDTFFMDWAELECNWQKRPTGLKIEWC